VRITYDPDADAAYIRVVDPIEPGAAITQVSLRPDESIHADFILDFDSEGSLLGIEILGARRGLRPETIAAAERLN